MRDRTDAGWLNESRHSEGRLDKTGKQMQGEIVSRVWLCQSVLCMEWNCSVEGLFLSVLQECAEGRGHARQSPCRSCTATKETTVSEPLGPHEVSTQERI